MASRWEVTKAVRASTLPAPSRLIMLVLADVADVDSGEIPDRFTPSLTDLVRQTSLDRSTVTRHLNLLEAGGWVERARPEVVAARVNGERTRYRLTVPTGTSTSTLGADSTYLGAENTYLGAENNQGRCTMHLDLGAPCTCPRCTVHPNRQISSDQTDLPPTAGAAAPRETPTHLGDIVAAYVDGATSAGLRRPSERLRGKVGRDARRLHEREHVPLADLATAAREMGARGWDDLDRELQRVAARASPAGQPPSRNAQILSAAMQRARAAEGAT